MRTTVPVGNFPAGVAVSPDGEFVYVSNRDGGSVSVISTASGQGANAPADVLSFIAIGWDQGTAEEFCALAPEDWLDTFEIEAGNIKVND